MISGASLATTEQGASSVSVWFLVSTEVYVGKENHCSKKCGLIGELS